MPEALRLETRREAGLNAEEGVFEGVTLWRRKGLPQQTHSLIENPPRSSQTLLKIQVTTDHGSVGFLDRRQSQDVLLQRLNVHLKSLLSKLAG
jgi:hypothetical protein